MERCQQEGLVGVAPPGGEVQGMGNPGLADDGPQRDTPDQQGDKPAKDCTLGTLLLRQGQVEQALSHFSAALSASPDYFDALFNGGLCYLHLEDPERALQWFSKAARLRPEDWQTQYICGEILLQGGRRVEALPYFKAAHVANQTHFETLQGLAIALLGARRFEEVVAVCDTTITLHGTATLPLQLKGDAMLALGMYEEAVRCHVDLCRIDLDIRDFLISRLQTLKEEDEPAFRAYAEIVHRSYPELRDFVMVRLPAAEKACSGCAQGCQTIFEEAGK